MFKQCRFALPALAGLNAMRALVFLSWLPLVAPPAALAVVCAPPAVEVVGECIQPGEVIGVVPDAVCWPNEVEYNGWCYSMDAYNRSCFYTTCDGIPPPPGTPGRPAETAQPPPPSPPLPPTPTTKEQCQDALRECRHKALHEGIQNCEARWAGTTGDLVRQGKTCFDDPSQVWQDLYVAVRYPSEREARDLSGSFVKCYQSDFGFGHEEGSYEQACTARFLMEAATRCAIGPRDKETEGSPVPVYFEVPFDIVTIGVQANPKVSVPSNGFGYRELCTGAGIKVVETTCAERHTQCVKEVQGGTLKVQGGTPEVQGGPPKVQGDTAKGQFGTFDFGIVGTAVVVLPSAVEELLARVDQERLGLASKGTNTGRPTVLDRPEPAAGNQTTRFRSIEQQPDENEQTYRARLEFLGDWSEFIERTGLRGEPQRLVELGLLDAQQGFTRADEEWIALLTRVWVPSLDPQRQRGSLEADVELYQYHKQGGLSGRVQAVEEALFDKVRELRGTDFLRAFQEDVWPGLMKFGIARPMARGVEAE